MFSGLLKAFARNEPPAPPDNQQSQPDQVAAPLQSPPNDTGVISMADSHKANVEAQSKEAVAFNMMQHIGALENPTDESKSSRAYWLKLYRECHRTVSAPARRKKKAKAVPAA